MTVFQARKWLIIYSLGIAGGSFLFFVLSPVFGYPLLFSQSMSILQIIFPVFLGYIGAATQFAFSKETPTSENIQENPMMNILVKGPIIVFGLAMVGGIFAFGYSNRESTSDGNGMGINDLANIVTTALGLLAVSTNVIVGYLFSVEKKPS